MAPSRKKAQAYECFFVTPIGEAGSDFRKRADSLLNHVLRPISKGFLEIVRADEVDEPGTITTDIVQRLYQNPLVIADLTGHNPNVMYEVGLRHCFNLPIVHIAQSGDKPPFDLAAERIIFFDLYDLQSVEEGKKRILKACKSALAAKPFRSPVVRALEKETLFAELAGSPALSDFAERFDALESAVENAVGEINDFNHETIYDAIQHFAGPSVDYDDGVLSELRDVLSMLNRQDLFELAKAVKRYNKENREHDAG